MSDSQYAVQITGLTKAFGSRLVLRGVTLAVCEGEAVAMMGPNGAGKTTLLRCIASTVRPTSGEIRCFGADMRDHRQRTLLGIVSHESRLYPNLSLKENLQFAAHMVAVPDPEPCAMQWLQKFGLQYHADRLPRQVSRGMRQRVSLARACLHQPRLLLLDEPFTGLDSEGRETLIELFRDLKQQRCTLCFATHDASAAANLADRIVRLDAGRLQADDLSNADPVEHPVVSRAA